MKKKFLLIVMTLILLFVGLPIGNLQGVAICQENVQAKTKKGGVTVYQIELKDAMGEYDENMLIVKLSRKDGYLTVSANKEDKIRKAKYSKIKNKEIDSNWNKLKLTNKKKLKFKLSKKCVWGEYYRGLNSKYKDKGRRVSYKYIKSNLDINGFLLLYVKNNKIIQVKICTP